MRIVHYLRIIMKWRKIVLLNTLTITMIAVIISLILPPQYTAVATVLPPSDDNMMFGLMSTSVSSGLAGLAKMGASIPGLATPSDLFAAILRSDRIKTTIITKYNLMDVFKTKLLQDALKALDEITKIEVTPEGIISITVKYTDKNLAAEIANAYVEELDSFNNETAMTTGKKYRIFIEERLMATLDTLTQAENALKNFQEKYHTIALDVEIENAIATIAELKSRIIFLEVKRGVLSSGSYYSNPQLYNLNREINELKKQLAELEIGGAQADTVSFGAGFSIPFSEIPEVSLKYFRLLRDVKVQEAIYELMAQQYEQAKIMELKDTPTVQLLDRANPPERRSFPERKKIVFVVFVLSFFIGVGHAFALEYFAAMKQQKGGEEWRQIGNTLKEDFEKVRIYIKKTIKREI